MIYVSFETKLIAIFVSSGCLFHIVVFAEQLTVLRKAQMFRGTRLKITVHEHNTRQKTQVEFFRYPVASESRRKSLYHIRL